MTSKLRLVRATIFEVHSLLKDVREADAEEWALATLMPLSLTLTQSVERTRNSRAVLDHKGDCLALWGVSPSDRPEVGFAWMVATKGATRRLVAMHRLFAQGISEMHDLYPHLEAWAYEGNTLHHRWMERMGFRRTGHEVVSKFDFKFFQFARSR